MLLLQLLSSFEGAVLQIEKSQNKTIPPKKNSFFGIKPCNVKPWH